MQGLNAVTTLQTFGPDQERPLFSVNAGIPVEQALDKAITLISCVQAMYAIRASSAVDLDKKAIQCVAQAACAILQACRREAGTRKPVH